ncbi:MAG: hypothetical protein AAF573_22000, partial [Bacteroidota bacterium]
RMLFHKRKNKIYKTGFLVLTSLNRKDLFGSGFKPVDRQSYILGSQKLSNTLINEANLLPIYSPPKWKKDIHKMNLT